MNLDKINERKKPKEVEPRTWWQLVKDLIEKARKSVQDVDEKTASPA